MTPQPAGPFDHSTSWGVGWWVAGAGGKFCRGQGTELAVVHPVGISVALCFLCHPFPPLALVPLSCLQHCLFCRWGTRGKKVSSSASCLYSSSLTAACAHLHPVYETIQTQFQPGSRGSMARHTHFPLTSSFSIWKMLNALSEFLLHITSLTGQSMGEKQEQLRPRYLPASTF